MELFLHLFKIDPLSVRVIRVSCDRQRDMMLPHLEKLERVPCSRPKRSHASDGNVVQQPQKLNRLTSEKKRRVSVLSEVLREALLHVKMDIFVSVQHRT